MGSDPIRYASRHLVLVGLMATGKSTVGRLLAERLDRPLLDSDDQVEARTGRTVREIWATDGEAAFRRFETDALIAALDDPAPAVIAAAGGVVLAAENRDCLRRPTATVVWLRADPATLLTRVAAAGDPGVGRSASADPGREPTRARRPQQHGVGRSASADPGREPTRARRPQQQSHRPLLDEDPAGMLETMAEDRTRLYESVADVTVDVDHRTPDEVADAVLAAVDRTDDGSTA